MRKEFLIVGNGKVKTVGFRPLLTSVGYLDYHVKVYASNVPGENKVMVVIEGEEDKINKFIGDVREKKIKPEELKAADYEVKGNSETANNGYDYLEHTQALQLDQMGTFVSEAKKMRGEITGVRTEISGMRGEMGGMRGELGTRLEELPDKIGERIDRGFKDGFKQIARAIKGE